MSDAPATRAVVRSAVRAVLDRNPALQAHPALKRRLARPMERISMTAANLIEDEERLSEQLAAPRRETAIAETQAAGDINRQTATRAVAPTLQATRQAIDFPGFVTSLITGVFQAMTTSSLQQLEAYGDLLEAVGTSTTEFSESQIDDDRAGAWLAQRFPSLAYSDGEITLREGRELPTTAQLREGLGANASELQGLSPDDLGDTLLPVAKRKLGRDRQSRLATMVLMGINRIVVDEGRIHASMELGVQGRSTAEHQQAERADARVTTSASGSFGVGLWGASASLSASVGYVRSDEQWSREDIAVRAGLRSSVDVSFHTEQVSLDRIANPRAQRQLRSRAMVPEAETAQADLLTADQRQITRPSFGDVPGAPDATADAERARTAREAAGRERESAAVSPAPATGGTP